MVSCDSFCKKNPISSVACDNVWETDSVAFAENCEKQFRQIRWALSQTVEKSKTYSMTLKESESLEI